MEMAILPSVLSPSLVLFVILRSFSPSLVLSLSSGRRVGQGRQTGARAGRQGALLGHNLPPVLSGRITDNKR